MKICICFACVLVLIVIVLTYFLSDTAKVNLDIVNTTTHACVGDVKHCGCCGACSTAQDLALYEDMTEKARRCAVDRFFESTLPCFEKIGLTTPCAQCWKENVDCTKQHCWFPCIMETILGIKSATLTQCLACDEVHCGAAFAKCAGMTRRRAGMITDIQRDPREICDLNFTSNGTQCLNE